MVDAADDLSTPLGQKPARIKRRLRLPFTAMQGLAVVLGLILATFAGFALFNKDPLGGEPVARVAINAPTTSPDKLDAHPPAPGKPAESYKLQDAEKNSAANKKTITIIDGSSGARHDVLVSNDPDAKVSDAKSSDARASDGSPPPGIPAISADADARLLEKSRFGMVPIAADGLKPVTAYAGGSEADRARAAKMPSVAIVIGGLGIGAAKTTDAIMKLPPPVTLAFTPYGADPGKLVERARAMRHEVFLQVPMEPFDYPDNDPGPQTLLTTISAEQNIERMLWSMSRFQSYAGIANFMGSRFVVTDAAMQPVVREAAKRGLGYFDDGAAPRSLAPSLAEGQAMPFARADLTIDAVPSTVEIDRALSKLEGLAKEKGFAVGVASALPATIDRVSNWAKALESRGILLVPLTTAMLKSKSS